MPIMRGVGHRNFISSLKFDKYFQTNYQKYLQTQFEAEAWAFNEDDTVEMLDNNSGSDSRNEDDVGDEGYTNLENYSKKHKNVEEEK